MRHNSIKLSRRHEWCAYVVTGTVFATGAAWAYLHYCTSRPNEFGASSPTEIWLMKAHGAAAMAALDLLGTLLPMHVKFAWRARRNLRTGLTVLAFFSFLALSGYGLYYAGSERLRACTSSSHLWVGLALPLVLGGHVWWGKRTSRKRSRLAK